jgi:hypothetical protein
MTERTVERDRELRVEQTDRIGGGIASRPRDVLPEVSALGLGLGSPR